jgi:ABC-type transporter Mla subunit MlaD
VTIARPHGAPNRPERGAGRRGGHNREVADEKDRQTRTDAGGRRASRVPPVVGALPIIGDLARTADSQAQWVGELIEQNARLVGQLPVTLKNLNDSIERFNQTISRLDRAVTRIESTTSAVVAPLEQVSPQLDRVVSLLEGIVAVLGDLPGAGLLRRIGRPAASPAEPGADPNAGGTRPGGPARRSGSPRPSRRSRPAAEPEAD